MNTKLKLVMFSIMFSGLFYSCSEEENAMFVPDTNSLEKENVDERYRTVSKEGKVVNYVYYMDEEETEAFNVENNDLYTVITTEPSEDGTEGVFKIWSFTTRQGYIDFGTKNNGNLEIGLKFEEHMREYAETSGAIAYYEETGEVPEWYLEYNKDYYESLFGPIEDDKGRTAAWNFFFTTTSLYTDAPMGQGRHTLMIGYSPWLIFGWNNQVSRYHNFQFYGVTTFHDLWAYRQPFFSLWDWGWNDVQFVGPLAFANDRMSSGFSWGFGLF